MMVSVIILIVFLVLMQIHWSLGVVWVWGCIGYIVWQGLIVRRMRDRTFEDEEW